MAYHSRVKKSPSKQRLLLRQRFFTDPPVPLWRKIFYGFSGLPKTTTMYVINAYFTIFLLEVVKIQPGYTSIVLLVGKLLSAFSDPLIGFFISRTPSTRHLGKTRPWILAAAPCALVSYFFLWITLPSGTPTWAKVLYYTLLYWFYNLALVAYYTPCVCSVIGFSNSQLERDTLVAYRITMESVGAILGMSIHAVYSYVGSFNNWPIGLTYSISALTIDLVFLISSIAAFISIQERYFLVTSSFNFFKYYKEILGFKSFILLALSFFFANMGTAVVTGAYALFFEYVFYQLRFFPLCMVVIFLSAAIFVPGWQLVLKFIGKKTTFTIGLLGMMTLYWAHLYLTWILPLVIVLCIIGGAVVGCIFLVPQSMIPDVIASFSIEHGTGREPMFFTVTGFLDTAGQAVALACTTLILEFVGYKTGASAAEQPSDVALALRLIIGCFPVVCGLCAIILMWEYPIDEGKRKEMHEQIKRSLSTVSKYGTTIYVSEPDTSASE